MSEKTPNITRLLKTTGKTPEGKSVVAGVFKLEDTYGLPLPLTLGLLKNANMIPDWVDFYDQARENGWKHKTVIAKLREAIREVYGPEFQSAVVGALELYESYYERNGSYYKKKE